MKTLSHTLFCPQELLSRFLHFFWNTFIFYFLALHCPLLSQSIDAFLQEIWSSLHLRNKSSPPKHTNTNTYTLTLTYKISFITSPPTTITMHHHHYSFTSTTLVPSWHWCWQPSRRECCHCQRLVHALLLVLIYRVSQKKIHAWNLYDHFGQFGYFGPFGPFWTIIQVVHTCHMDFFTRYFFLGHPVYIFPIISCHFPLNRF